MFFIILLWSTRVNSYVSLSSNIHIYHHVTPRKEWLILHVKKDTSPKKGFGPVKKDIGNDADASVVTQRSSRVDMVDKLETVQESAVVDGSDKGVAMSEDDMILNTKMFKSDRLRREDLLNEKIKRLKAEDDLIATDPSVGAVPELVADRMIRRIAVFFGVPVFGGLSIFVGAFFYSRKYDLTLPPVVVAYATQFPFVLGLMGITYGILSSSWDNVSIMAAMIVLLLLLLPLLLSICS